jgi:putative intracellular protease/amidase
VDFATENGKVPACDRKLLEGMTQKLLGANQAAISQYRQMEKSIEWQHPLAWTKPGFVDSAQAYDAMYFTGGHEKGVRQILDSPIVHEVIAKYFPQTRRSDGGRKVVSALCHGVQTVSKAHGADGRSVLYEVETTALPTRFEQFAFWSTRAMLGDYYKTYGVGSDNVEEAVRKTLKDDKKQYKNSLSMSP